MGNKLVVLIPFIALILTISAAVGVIASQGISITLPVELTNFLSQRNLPRPLQTYFPHTSEAELLQVVNQSRIKSGLTPLTHDTSICSSAQVNNGSEADTVFSNCKNCSHAAILKISSLAQPTQLIDYLQLEASANQIIHNPKLTHICIQEKDNTHTIFVVAYRDPDISPLPSQPSPPPVIVRQSEPIPASNFTEDELWQALVDYRHAHKRSDLIRDENLCVYARKRVQDHLAGYKNIKPEDFPVPGKYPLDAHAGFSADADSGYAFEVAGKNRLAENLAYWPSAEFANQIIEWGWDSSTEGHRETQLSNDYSHACITSQDGFYVAIYGG